MSKEQAALALTRFGLGARPGDIERIAGDPRGALLAELEEPAAGRLDRPDLPSGADAYVAIRRDQIARASARRANNSGHDAMPAAASAGMASPAMAAGGAAGASVAGGMTADRVPAVAQQLYQKELAARLDAMLAAKLGYVERLVAFWSNHFAVQAEKEQRIRGLAGAFEREAIRPHVLGRFEDMLLAATRHPAMLVSLDNVESYGPDSPAGLKLRKGLNENHAREILELHTVGVRGGYHQEDVTEFARILTGWTFTQSLDKPGPGTFLYQAWRHEPGDRHLMGKLYPAGPKGPSRGEQQGLAALHDLAVHPATARHIATKLARHFVDDQPPPALVQTLAGAFRKTGGDLKAVSVALIRSDLAWGKGRKFSTPQQFVVSALRAGGGALDSQRAIGWMRALGETPWSPTSPEGFHDDAASWLSPEGMTTRLDVADRIAQQTVLGRAPQQLAQDVIGPKLSAETLQSIERAESGRQAFALLMMSPEFQWRGAA